MIVVPKKRAMALTRAPRISGEYARSVTNWRHSRGASRKPRFAPRRGGLSFAFGHEQKLNDRTL
jgi:hypothetical protein